MKEATVKNKGTKTSRSKHIVLTNLISLRALCLCVVSVKQSQEYITINSSFKNKILLF